MPSWDRAWELGITLFDTADAYGGGRSEAMIGAWLEDKGPEVRDQLILSSKVSNPVGEGPNDRGLSRRHIMRQIDASLERLGVDHLDLYLIHAPDPSTPLEETLEALDDLVHRGRVHYLGASNMPAWLTTKALWLSDRLNLQRFDWVQNLLQPSRPHRRARDAAAGPRSGARLHALQPPGGRVS